MPAVELDQAMRADFEAWSVSAGFAYRNHQGFWFYRNGGDGMFEAYCAGAVKQLAMQPTTREMREVIADMRAAVRDGRVMTSEGDT